MKPIHWLCALLLAIMMPITAVAANVAPPDLKWWHHARFGMLIHWGPAALTGKEISWSRRGTGVEEYDNLYKEFNPVEFDAKALELGAIPPTSSSGSLAYQKPATASSSIAAQFMHNAAVVFDDNPDSFWTPGRDEAISEFQLF